MIDIIRDYWQLYLYTDGYQPTGLVVTLWLLAASVVLGFALAVPLSIARASPNRWLSAPVWLYTYVFRGTPLYVQLLLCYSGLYGLEVVQAHAPLADFFRSAMNCTLLAFALNECAYTTEILAGAIRSTAYGEVEAGRAYGMSSFTLYRRIVLPSALRRALPMYGNEVILMLHSTTLAFTATVPDLMKVTRDVNSATYASFPAFGISACLYAAVAFALVGIFRMLEGRWLAFLKPAAAGRMH
ncbi:ABC transporter permease [Burkholderia alba]|uniref:ABC transporter permease n=1 Tax=Burkholderia alba TaxID=2683677 RepID=UPI002B059A00|nr:ABC transporter permease [Burkholderia alba]